jgi:hypothetical protein
MTFLNILGQWGIDFVHNVFTFGIPVLGAAYIAIRLADKHIKKNEIVNAYMKERRPKAVGE